MNNKISYAALVVALLALVLPQFQAATPASSPTEKTGIAAPFLNTVASLTGNNNSVLERVTNSKTLRCAYLVYPPETIKDVNSGKLSGWIVELTEAMAAELGWKVEWTAEVGFADMFAGFATKKYDAICAGAYETPQRSLHALYSVPVVYGATYAFVRANDTRFDDDQSAANSPDVSVAFMDGEITQAIAEQNFPNARKYSLPTMAGIPLLLEAVANGKSDMTFTQLSAAKSYMEHNAGKMKMLGDAPVHTYVQSLLALPLGEHDLKYVIDATLRTLQENGTVERLIRKYEVDHKSYLLPIKAYQKPAP
jgi:ABC-type amino acid transport substrate-binding protein